MNPDLIVWIGWVVGCVLVGLVVLQTLIAAVGGLWRLSFQGRHHALELEVLRSQIETARLAQEKVLSRRQAWEGSRKFVVARKVLEARDTCSIYLKPHDGRPLPTFHPGQFLTFRLHVNGEALTRCYSLSDAPSPEYFRITVKKVPAPRDRPDLPSGRSSTYFVEQVREGDLIDVEAPRGKFYLDLAKEGPAVLIGGGIGITPVLSMLNTLVNTGRRREVWFFLGVRNRTEHAFKEHLEKIARENDNVHLHVCYSDPSDQDRAGVDYQHKERVSVELFKRLLPSSNYDFYICGPGPMMNSLTEGLEAWGVPKDRVHFEAFGPASVKKVTPPPAPAEAAGAAGVSVRFARSGKQLAWDGAKTLLDLAESAGLSLKCGCRAGNCGECQTAIRSGKVKYPGGETCFSPQAGSCLACMAVPDGPVELDA